jgi:hypothetical protein
MVSAPYKNYVFHFCIVISLFQSQPMTSPIDSLDLWAASNFIGRECATINKDYVLCKSEKGGDPKACLEEGNLANSCASEV